jgi:hypothetical protein
MTIPIEFTMAKATIAPLKTIRRSPVFDIMRTAANCFLSPSSTRKIVPARVRQIVHSIFSSFQLCSVTETVFRPLE